MRSVYAYVWALMVKNSTNIKQKQKQKQTTTSHLKSLNTKKNMTYANGNPNLGFGQEQNCTWDKSVDGIPISPPLYDEKKV